MLFIRQSKESAIRDLFRLWSGVRSEPQHKKEPEGEKCKLIELRERNSLDKFKGTPRSLTTIGWTKKDRLMFSIKMQNGCENPKTTIRVWFGPNKRTLQGSSFNFNALKNSSDITLWLRLPVSIKAAPRTFRSRILKRTKIELAAPLEPVLMLFTVLNKEFMSSVSICLLVSFRLASSSPVPLLKNRSARPRPPPQAPPDRLAQLPAH